MLSTGLHFASESTAVDISVSEVHIQDMRMNLPPHPLNSRASDSRNR